MIFAEVNFGHGGLLELLLTEANFTAHTVNAGYGLNGGAWKHMSDRFENSPLRKTRTGGYS